MNHQTRRYCTCSSWVASWEAHLHIICAPSLGFSKYYSISGIAKTDFFGHKKAPRDCCRVTTVLTRHWKGCASLHRKKNVFGNFPQPIGRKSSECQIRFSSTGLLADLILMKSKLVGRPAGSPLNAALIISESVAQISNFIYWMSCAVRQTFCEKKKKFYDIWRFSVNFLQIFFLNGPHNRNWDFGNFETLGWKFQNATPPTYRRRKTVKLVLIFFSMVLTMFFESFKFTIALCEETNLNHWITSDRRA